jgi:D-serine deaminase-like pyridoxal phosphate-dependent protein
MSGATEFDTPCLVIDEAVTRRNVTTMAEEAQKRGVRLRPHVKTHKIPAIAQLQMDSGACGITVAKVSEAEVMVAHGLTDVFIAYPLVTPEKVRRALALSDRATVTLSADSSAGLDMIAAHARSAGINVDVRLEIDTGYNRTGIPPSHTMELARYASGLDGIQLTGIFTFRENTFSDGTTTLDTRAAGAEEGALMSELAASLRQAGIPIADVSVGSTPTALSAGTIDGVTEIRPGTYVFQDRMQQALGACRREDIAAKVRTTVVSRPSRNLAIVDAGTKAISVDTRPEEAPTFLRGFAEVIDQPDMILRRLSEEHGMLYVPDDSDLQIGQQVDLLPNHICTTVALYDTAAVVNAQGLVRYETIAARGKFT